MARGIITYLTIERWAAIRRKLVAGECFTSTTLAAELECSIKTIHRDIEFLRDQFGYNLEFNHHTHTWTGSPPAEPIL